MNREEEEQESEDKQSAIQTENNVTRMRGYVKQQKNVGLLHSQILWVPYFLCRRVTLHPSLSTDDYDFKFCLVSALVQLLLTGLTGREVCRKQSGKGSFAEGLESVNTIKIK